MRNIRIRDGVYRKLMAINGEDESFSELFEGPARDDLLKRFSDFRVVYRRFTASTAKAHRYDSDRFLRWPKKPLNRVEANDMREYLKQYLDVSPSTYANQIKALRVFFRDFLGRGEAVRSFRFPGRPFSPKSIPTKAQLRKAYDSLDTPRERAIFLLYATSGLRKNELLRLDKESVDFEKRMIIPKHSTRTKNAWVSFFNQKTKAVLDEYLATRNDKSPRLVAVKTDSFNQIWKKASETAGIKITPQVFREWFCCEMANLGVQDRYVDALCGRMPKSVLARHYTDYSPDKLKNIYDKADLKVIS